MRLFVSFSLVELMKSVINNGVIFENKAKYAKFVKKFFEIIAKYLQFFRINWYIMEINLYLEAYIR